MSRADDLRTIDRSMTTLARVANSRRARRQLEDRAGLPLGPTTIATLAAVRALGPARHSAVTGRVGVQPSRISKEVRLLVERGYVAEHADPHDRRATLLEITTDGDAAYRAYRRAVEETLTEVLDGWSDTDLHQLSRLIARLADDVATG